MYMNRKINLTLLALLGFSTGCSSVKNTPREGKAEQEPVTEEQTPAIQVMYGVRQPVGPEFVNKAYPLEETDSLGSAAQPAAGQPAEPAAEPAAESAADGQK